MAKFVNGAGACFFDYQVAIDRKSEGYKDTWYDKEGADDTQVMYSITVPAKSGDLYISVESYYLDMVPDGCTTGTYQYTDSNGNT
jgi:hypothetical protein